MKLVDLLLVLEGQTYCILICDRQYLDEGVAIDLLSYCFNEFEKEVLSIEVEDNGDLRITIDGGKE